MILFFQLAVTAPDDPALAAETREGIEAHCRGLGWQILDCQTAESVPLSSESVPYCPDNDRCVSPKSLSLRSLQMGDLGLEPRTPSLSK